MIRLKNIAGVLSCNLMEMTGGGYEHEIVECIAKMQRFIENFYD